MRYLLLVVVLQETFRPRTHEVSKLLGARLAAVCSRLAPLLASQVNSRALRPHGRSSSVFCGVFCCDSKSPCATSQTGSGRHRYPGSTVHNEELICGTTSAPHEGSLFYHELGDHLLNEQFLPRQPLSFSSCTSQSRPLSKTTTQTNGAARRVESRHALQVFLPRSQGIRPHLRRATLELSLHLPRTSTVATPN